MILPLASFLLLLRDSRSFVGRTMCGHVAFVTRDLSSQPLAFSRANTSIPRSKLTFSLGISSLPRSQETDTQNSNEE